MNSSLKNKYWLIAFSVIFFSVCAIGVIQYTRTANTPNDDNALTSSQTMAESHNIHILHVKKPEKGLLLYVSGNSVSEKTIENAKKFANLHYYVAIIQSDSLLSKSFPDSGCQNMLKQLSNITKKLQATYHIASTALPILVGDNEGAALVYVALAQAEKNSFHAGISINFTPQLKTGSAICALNKFNSIPNGSSSISMLPAKHLTTNWYIFQNNLHAQNTTSNQFIAQVNNAKLTLADNTNTDPIAETIQILQWLDPRLADQISSNNSGSDLPLIEVVAKDNRQHTHSPTSQKTMAVLLTGDGGWAEIDKQLANILAEKGIPTIALDSLSYFWRARTQAETAQDIESIIQLYQEKWQKKEVILIGYSFGADVLPFIANKLSEQNKNNITLIALLGMGKTAAFEFRLASWMNADTHSNRLPVLPEVKEMQWANSICIYGVEDKESACTLIADTHVKTISMSGDHHFDENYNLLVQHILDNIKPIEATSDAIPPI